MRLALVISSLSSGGAERIMSLLANHWAGRGDHIALITLDTSASDCYDLDPRITRIGLGMLGASLGSMAAVVKNCRRIMALRTAVAEAGAETVLSFEDQTNVLVVLATRCTAIRLVISARTDPTRHRIAKQWNLLRRLTYPLAEALVVQTEALLPWARSIMGKQRTYAIPNPVRNMRCFARGSDMTPRPVIVAVGRLAAEKGFDILVRAFAGIAAKFTDWTLIILGQGPEHRSLAILAQTLGVSDRVSLPGWICEPGEVLATASLFVMPSRYEGFPNALLEAMACGLPVISTACAGPQEIITNEVDGILVPIDSVDSLANAIARLIEDRELRTRIGCNAREVCVRYNIESVVKRWDAILCNQPLTDARAFNNAPAGQQ